MAMCATFATIFSRLSTVAQNQSTFSAVRVSHDIDEATEE